MRLVPLLAFAAICSTALPARADAPPPHEHFENALRQAVAPAAGHEVVGLKVLHLSGDVGPWLDTGLALQAGERLTLLASGTLWWSRAYGLSLPPAQALWGRIGDGPIFRGERDTQTIRVERDGRLQLKLFPGLKWLDRHGAYAGEPAPLNPDAGGGISVAIIRWAPGADIPAALARMAAQPEAARWLNAERTRLERAPQPAPAGWQHLWELGPSEIFSATQKPQAGGSVPAIAVHTHDDVGILHKAADFALGPDTRLSWDWKIDRLPSAKAETSIPTHDYLSIAVEFDNGRDLTFLWSRELPVGEIFDCPLPAWKGRETHVVARSGEAELGRWLGESVNVADLYRQAIGGPLPGRIVRVWLIANSLFQKGEGRGEFANIALSDGPRRLDVR